MSDDLSSRFPQMQPIRSAPSLSTVNGIGCVVYGRRDVDPETGTYVKTHCFTVLFVPVFTLGAYRVADAPQGWYFLGREPLSGVAKLWNVSVLGLLLGLVGLLWWTSHTNSPTYKARQKVEEADRLAEAGDLEKAATLYREVADGTTEHAGSAAAKFKGLLKEPLDRASAQTTARVLRLAVAWQSRLDVREGLAERGLELARKKGADEPQDAVAILDAIEPLHPKREEYLKLRRSLLEQAVAKAPQDLEPAVQLALVYEAQDELPRCEKLLAPHAAKLGTTEGARILGRLLAHQGNTEQAYKLLRNYADEHLKHLHEAEKTYQVTRRASEEAILNELRSGSAPGFAYQEWQSAPKAKQQAMVGAYIEKRRREDPAVRAAEATLVRHRPVVDVALDLGLVHLSRARGLKEEARKAELQKAEGILKAVRGTAGPTSELRLGQVYYWMGRPAEGKKLFDELLAATNRSPEGLLQVSIALREDDLPKKQWAAALRALLRIDLEDAIVWLERTDTSQVETKAKLAWAQGHLALQRGKEREAAEQLREAVRLYASLPEDASTLNDGGLAHLSLYEVTGEVEHLDRARTMLEKALALNPSDSILVTNVLTITYDSTSRSLLGKAVDLTALRQRGQLDFLPYLYVDRKGRDDYAERVRKHPGVARLTSQANRLMLLAPKQPTSYAWPLGLHGLTRDLAGLRALEKQLQEVELDLTDSTREQLEFFARKKDAKVREERKARTERWEKHYQRFQKERSVTFAVVAVTLAKALIDREEIGEEVDADRVVRLAEEAHAAAPSVATHNFLVSALLFRAHRQFTRQEPEYHKRATQARRALDPDYLLAVALSQGGRLREAVLANKDVRRAGELLRKSTAEFADEISPWACVMLQAIDPEGAAARTEALGKNELGKLIRAIRLRLAPSRASTALDCYWELKLAGKEEQGKAILKRCADLGVPLPLDVR